MNHITAYIKNNKKELLIAFLLLIAYTGIFALNRSAPDTYSLESYKYLSNGLPYFKDGRFFMTAFVLILEALHIPYNIFKLCSWGLAFVSLYFGVIIFNGMLKKATNKSNVLLSFLTIVNIFVLEYFIFADYSGIMCLGILNAVLSANFCLDFFKTRKKKFIVLSIMFSLFTTFCYQGVISLVVILPIVFTLKYSKKIKDFIINNLWIVLIYAVPSFAALFIGKLLGTYRLAATHASFLDRIQVIFSQTVELLVGTAMILPKYLFIILTIIGIILFVIAIYSKKDRWIKYLFLLYCLLAGLIVPLAPQFVIDYNNIWLTPRSSVGLGILCLIPLLLYEIYSDNKNKKFAIIFTCVLLILSIFQFRGYLSMAYNQIKNNTLEEVEANKILNKIYNYEQENGKLKNIVIYADKNITYVYPGIKAYKDINTRVGSRDWGTKAILYRVLKRKLKTRKDENFKDYCQSNDWDTYSDENIKIENNSLYVCIY